MIATSSPSFATAHSKRHDKETVLKRAWIWPSVSILTVIFPSFLAEMGSCSLPWAPQASSSLAWAIRSSGPSLVWNSHIAPWHRGSRRRAILFTSSSRSFLGFAFIVFLNVYIPLYFLFLIFFFFSCLQLKKMTLCFSLQITYSHWIIFESIAH